MQRTGGSCQEAAEIEDASSDHWRSRHKSVNVGLNLAVFEHFSQEEPPCIAASKAYDGSRYSDSNWSCFLRSLMLFTGGGIRNSWWSYEASVFFISILCRSWPRMIDWFGGLYGRSTSCFGMNNTYYSLAHHYRSHRQADTLSYQSLSFIVRKRNC